MKTKYKLLIIIGLLLSALLFLSYDWKKENNTSDSKTIVVLVKYKSQPSKENESIIALTKLIEEVKKEPHFESITLHVDPKDKSTILLYEKWSDETYFTTKHMQTTHLQNFIADSKNFLVGPPEISFWKVEKEFK
jgi:quinol monooxygenase YgiN